MAGPASYAQTLGVVKGTVRDAQSRKPLALATASLTDRVDTTARVIGAVCDKDGDFDIEGVVVGHEYVLKVGFIGYKADSGRVVKMDGSSEELDLGDIMLRQDSVKTRDVIVTEKRPDVAVMADKTVYAVEQSGAYSANNVNELLGQLPAVFVDQDGNISLRGDNNVQIMMNGRPLNMPTDQRTKFLQALPMSAVKDVEIRTTPGAQFDAKSSAGIINIITKRTMSDMFGGSVNAGVDSRVGADGGLGLYYNEGALSASLSGGFDRSTNRASSTNSRVNYLDSIEYRDEGMSRSKSSNNSLYTFGQIDYNINAQDVVSLSFYGSQWKSDYSAQGRRTFYDIDDNVTATFNDITERGAAAGNQGRDVSASVLYKHSFTEDHKLMFDATFEDDTYLSVNHYRGDYVDALGVVDSALSVDRNTLFDERSTAVVLKVDYENPLSDSLDLTGGLKSEINWVDRNTQVTDLDESTGERITDSLRSNHYLPEELTYAAYGNVSYRPFEKLNLQVGLRLEYALISATYISGEPVVDNAYLNLFPSGSASYSFSDEESLTLSYRRSVSLPDIESLNPLRVRWSEFYESAGNPDLLPEIIHSINLNYSMFWGEGNMWSVAPSFSTTKDDIQSSEEINDGVTTSTSANFNGTNRFTASTTMRIRPLEWLNIDVSAVLYTAVNRGGTVSGDFYSSGTGFTIHGASTADITESLSWRVSYEYYQPPTIGASQNGAYTSLRTSLRQKLFDEKLSISLNVNDPFNAQRWVRSFDSPEFRTQSTGRWQSRYVGLDVSYSFGTTPEMQEHDLPQGSGPRE